MTMASGTAASFERILNGWPTSVIAEDPEDPTHEPVGGSGVPGASAFVFVVVWYRC